MKNLTGTLEDGRNYEVVVTQYTDKIGTDEGAAPWMIGRTIKKTKRALFINGENMCGVTVRTHAQVQSLVNDFNL